MNHSGDANKMVCLRCGAALARLEDDSNGWLRLTRAIFSCGHSQYVAAEPGPERPAERPEPPLKRECERLCALCGVRLGAIRSSHQRVHSACAPEWARQTARQRAKRRQLQEEV